MIFVTVGSDIPFDRIIHAVDRWACARDRQDVFAQIGRGGWQPQFISFAEMLEPAEFRERLTASRIIVGHAGMGTILSALQYSKPILVMPRRGSLGETRNDHQMATARQLLEMEKSTSPSTMTNCSVSWTGSRNSLRRNPLRRMPIRNSSGPCTASSTQKTSREICNGIRSCHSGAGRGSIDRQDH